MKKYLLAAAAVAAVATAAPAVARDGSGYAGIEGGLLFPKTKQVTFDITGSGTYYETYDGDFESEGSFDTDYKRGIDVDLIAGYDFGMFRIEGELGWKGARHDRYKDSVSTYELIYDGEVVYDGESGPENIDADGHTRVVSLMANALLDFGNEDGLSFYAGAGIGIAKTKFRYEAEGLEIRAKDKVLRGN